MIFEEILLPEQPHYFSDLRPKINETAEAKDKKWGHKRGGKN